MIDMSEYQDGYDEGHMQGYDKGDDENKIMNTTNEIIRVTRRKHLKKDADRIAGWMKRVCMKNVIVYGKTHGSYWSEADATDLQLAEFCVIEAKYDMFKTVSILC